ncbi:methyltransferase [Archaeoglobus sulfaticallidus PM70-1]|uniref:tRNA (guanine(37)-N(1))-methyltransferase n=1 Tax=Archaeoglobus sulfaticallidus PM70-1 TaxID=387631 RepID=N0BLF3_9EURY|nr:class I SAM-dependent methyltransferase family protein [Archaeoglobus sulfaticallidus]AGK61005.1 methyltransferase [Archaeoglobus sulfaticallidus PM70-1]
MSLKKLLREKYGLDEEVVSKIRRSFEIIGDVVIVDIPDDVVEYKDLIIRGILEKHKHVRTILRKVGEVDGVYRVARYEKIFGDSTETIVKEHGCRFHVDPTKVYYSVKLSGERERISKLVDERERVLVMFAGVGPFAIVIAKKAKPKEVVGVEINPVAVEYFRKNVVANKVEDIVKVFEGDVREVMPKLDGRFDRILMPSPYIAENFVDVVGSKVKEGGYIHYYTFAGKEEKESILPERVMRLFADNGVIVDVENIRECGNYAPYVYRYVLDLKVRELEG